MKKTLLLLLLAISSFAIAQPGSNFYLNCDTFSFSNQVPHFIIEDTSSSNIWQRGNPNKLILTQAISDSNSYITDTINLYPPNNKSSFVIDWQNAVFTDCQMLGGYALSFVHSMNTDSLAGGYIEVSDDSLNWQNIFNTQNFGYSAGMVKIRSFQLPPQGNTVDYSFRPDTLFNGQLGFSGNYVSDSFYVFFNWILLREMFHPYLRFTFVSDSNAVGLDGWMIDDIVIGSYETWGSVSESLSKSITLYPNPANDKLAFDFDGNKFKPTELTITNVVGQRILEVPFSKTVDISTLQQGVYYVTITDGKGNSAAKMFYKQ